MKLAHRSYLFPIFFLLFSSLHAKQRMPAWPTGSYQASKDGISISSRILTEQETAALFDGKGKTFIKRGRRAQSSIIPYQLHIVNNTDHELILHDADIDLSLVNPLDIQKNRGIRNLRIVAITGSVLAGILCFPLAVGWTLYGGVLLGSAACDYALSALIVWLPATGPSLMAAGGGIAGYTAGRAYDYVFPTKQAEQQPLVIKPGETKKCMIFTLERDIKPLFKVSLSSLDNKKIMLEVTNTPSSVHWDAVRVI